MAVHGHVRPDCTHGWSPSSTGERQSRPGSPSFEAVLLTGPQRRLRGVEEPLRQQHAVALQEPRELRVEDVRDAVVARRGGTNGRTPAAAPWPSPPRTSGDRAPAAPPSTDRRGPGYGSFVKTWKRRKSSGRSTPFAQRRRHQHGGQRRGSMEIERAGLAAGRVDPEQPPDSRGARTARSCDEPAPGLVRGDVDQPLVVGVGGQDRRDLGEDGGLQPAAGGPRQRPDRPIDDRPLLQRRTASRSRRRARRPPRARSTRPARSRCPRYADDSTVDLRALGEAARAPCAATVSGTSASSAPGRSG